MFQIPQEDISSYIGIPAMFTNGKKNTAIFVADGGNHFTHLGIFEGMFLIFDLDGKYERGHLSCFYNCKAGEDHPRYKMSDVRMKGYKHIGRLIASVRNYEV